MGEHEAVRQATEAALAARQAEDAIVAHLGSREATVGSTKRLAPVLTMVAAARGQLEAAVKLHLAETAVSK